MPAQNFVVTFNTNVYSSKPWFQVPRPVAKLLGAKSGDALAVDINAPNGRLIYHGLAKLESGTEVYDAHISKQLKRGDGIRVTVSLPPEGFVQK
jgi:hypothetical protein